MRAERASDILTEQRNAAAAGPLDCGSAVTALACGGMPPRWERQLCCRSPEL